MELEKLHEGSMCNLKIGRWDASAKLPKDKLGKGIPKEIIRAMQDLVDDRTLLKDLATIRRTAKGELMRHSIPFPVDGVWFVPKEHIPYLDDRFSELKEENDDRVETLIANYGKLKSRMKKKYPSFYRKDKYPSVAELRKKYYFNWNFFNIGLPNGKASVLSPKMYRREQRKFAGMIKEMEEMTVNLVANRLVRRIKKLSSQCDSGKINAGTVNSIDRFLNKWDELWSGYVDETKMKSIMRQLRSQMKKVDTESLKDSEELREQLGGKISGMISKIKSIPNVQLKRKLDV